MMSFQARAQQIPDMKAKAANSMRQSQSSQSMTELDDVEYHQMDNDCQPCVVASNVAGGHAAKLTCSIGMCEVCMERPCGQHQRLCESNLGRVHAAIKHANIGGKHMRDSFTDGDEWSPSTGILGNRGQATNILNNKFQE